LTAQLTEQIKDAVGERYAVDREIGRGGMAIVYLAQDRRLGRKVAIKVLEPHVATEIARERFLREVEFAASLTHPNILPIFEAGEAAGLLYYVMPYIDGHSLRVWLAREGRIPYEETMQLAAEVADALDYAHRQHVIHRDIKPENILISNGHAIVADFGIARAICVACGDNLTVAGVPIGTPGYMSPEQGSGEEVDARTDVYSLGAVVFEMLTGTPPFRGPTVEAIIAARYTQPTPSLAREGWTLSDTVDQAVQKALQLDRNSRFDSTREFIDTIRPRPSGEFADTVPNTLTPPQTIPTNEEKSLAVLPFANLSADPENEYFSEGITEDIIAQLSKIRDVRVTSKRATLSYKGTDKSVGEIARELGVSTILEGTVRRSGHQVRVAAQLIDARRDQQLWSEQYDRELTDIFAIQDEIADHIATALRSTLTPQEKTQLARKPTTNLDAYNLYLKGRFHWQKFTPEGIRKGIDYFTEAATLDPRYALAHAGLADSYLILTLNLGRLSPSEGMPQVREAAQRAVECDPDLADARSSLGAVADWFDWDWARAEAEHDRAVELDPDGEKSRIMRAFHHAIMGRGEDAIHDARHAETMCPISALAASNVALQLYEARRYDEALEQVNRVKELDPNFPPAFRVLTWNFLLMGMPDQAVEAAMHSVQLTDHAPPRRAALACALAAAGFTEDAEQEFTALGHLRTTQFVSALDLALVAGYLGRTDEAFQLLDEAFAERAPWLTHLKANPVWDVLRDDARFELMTSRVGLP
jgi:eukaryotic-like serine/threonine-protein kinase